MIRLHLVGFGRWGRNYVTAARDTGIAEVSSITTGRGVLPPGDCDAVIYAGHPSGAVEACANALRAGKPILCEKPAGLSLGDAEAILEAEQASSAFVLVGHQHLFAAAYEALRDRGPHPLAHARFTGPVSRDYPAVWDYGPHAVSTLLGLGSTPFPKSWVAGLSDHREARVTAPGGTYDGYAPHSEPPLTRQVREFAKAVKAGGTDDYRFGARWAVDVAVVLEVVSNSAA